MQTYYLLKLSLALHIAGFVTMAGLILANYVIFRQLPEGHSTNDERSRTLLAAASTLSRVAGLGGILLLLSGVAMMLLTQGVFMGQLWFKIKLGIIALIIVNGLLIIRRFTIQLHKLIQDGTDQHSSPEKFSTLKRRLHISSVFQLVFLLLIFFLAAFRIH